MLKIENFEVLGWEHAIRGMRNPMNSWEKSDSFLCRDDDISPCPEDCSFRGKCPVYGTEDFFVLGPNDYTLMKNLRNAGTDHRKFMRMITVYVDITAPLYWWKEFDTYKVSTTSNSCSTMHKIADKKFTPDDFSTEHLVGKSFAALKNTIEVMNLEREHYLATKDKDCWWQMIQLLPQSYNQKRTIMLNYEVLATIYRQRKGHKLDEWRDFCKWIEQLPYSELITDKEA